MSEIKCPHCGKAFPITQTEYDIIARQIHNDEFDNAVNKRITEIQSHLQEKFDSDLSIQLSKDNEKLRLKYEKEIKDLTNKLNKAISNQQNLENTIKQSQTEKELALEKANNKFEQEKLKLKEDFTQKENDLKVIIKQEQTELDFYKNFKAKQSTKAVGESLEQYCSDEFEKMRTLAFKGDYFEKDNEISESRSKGDFIYRSYGIDNEEIISIMFEMKNETDTTSTKHKNEHFFKELDKDRKEKHCEYAVLVSMLEPDSSLYNQGIVDVSHKYDKMYVVRPEFFIPLISLLRNMAKSQEGLKHQLVLAQRDNLDITNFEKDLLAYKDAFNKKREVAGSKFEETLKEIDRAIDYLQKTKENLQSCMKNLNSAGSKIDELSIKKLCKNNPTMTDAFRNIGANI